MIRPLQQNDTAQVMQLWLSGNEDAHAFIAKDYWRSHFSQVQEQLLQADVFVYEAGGDIRGFIGLVDDYIAGIFVDSAYRSGGIGRQLLAHAKHLHPSLSLSVYQQNKKAIAFYTREGFVIRSEGVDEATGEKEYTMHWQDER